MSAPNESIPKTVFPVLSGDSNNCDKEIVAMKECDDEFRTTSLVAKRIIPQMAQKKVPVTPENYYVWFEYSLGSIPELTDEMEQITESGADFTKETNQYLYSKYFGKERGEEFQKQLRKEAQIILKSALEGILAANNATSDYGNKLQGYTEKLNDTNELSDIQLVVQEVLKDTVEMTKATQTLQDRLDEATQLAEDLKVKLEATTRQALTDPLTGLKNRKAFDVKIKELFEEYANGGSSFAVMMLDIDYFKNFNDKYGHKMGDEVLQFVGSTLKQCLKGKDFPARYGGEEFIVLLPTTGTAGACAIAEQIRTHISQKKLKVIETGESLGSVTVSVGVSEMRSNDTVDSLIIRADKALYLAKDSGRNCIKSERDL